MKRGRTLTELANEITRQKNTKKDFVAQTRALSVRGDHGFRMHGLNGGNYSINDIAHGQIGQRLGIPKRYYDELRSNHPDMLTYNINELFRRKPQKRMVRTLDNRVRAFLSDRYRPIDNYNLAEAILPELSGLDLQVESCEITERRMYLKVVTPRIKAEIKKGDPVQAGLVISNSEVGMGSFQVSPMIFRLVCLNGLIIPDHSLRKYHSGSRFSLQGSVDVYSEKTMQLSNAALMSQVKDTIRAAIKQTSFNEMMSQMKNTTERRIEGDPVKVVELTAKEFALSDEDRGGVLNHLIRGGDLSQYGLTNAITRYSQDIKDYDEATELERTGGKVMALNDNQWKRLVEKAA